MTGTCVRNQKGELLAASSWIDAGDIWVELCIIGADGQARSLVINGTLAVSFAAALKAIVGEAELL